MRTLGSPRRPDRHAGELPRAPALPGDGGEQVRLHAVSSEDGVRGARFLRPRRPGRRDRVQRRRRPLQPHRRSADACERDGLVQVRVEHEDRLHARLVVDPPLFHSPFHGALAGSPVGLGLMFKEEYLGEIDHCLAEERSKQAKILLGVLA